MTITGIRRAIDGSRSGRQRQNRHRQQTEATVVYQNLPKHTTATFEVTNIPRDD